MRRLPGQLWRALTQPRRTKHEAAIALDWARFKRSARGWRARTEPQPPRGNALVVSLSDFVYQLKLEGVLMKSLQTQGFRPYVLSARWAERWATAYFGAYGITDLVYVEDYVRPEMRAEAERVARAFLTQDVTLQELKAFEFHGAKVGQQSISSLSRTFQQGRISLGDRAVRDHLLELLPQALESVLAGEALLADVAPEIVLFNERGYAGFGSIYDVALGRGANVVQFLHGGIHWADALLFKRYVAGMERIHPASLSDESWERTRAMEWTEQHDRELDGEFALRYGAGEKHPDAGLQEGKQIKTRDAVVAQLGLDPAKPTAVIFSHVLWDANMFYGDDLFEDQETWLVESVRAAVANPNANWIVKLHPANLYKANTSVLNDEVAIREAVGELPPHVKLMRPETDVNTFSLFTLADVAITIRGTVGLETPCFGIRTLTAGTGRYSGLGFTDDSSSAAEYLDKLARVHELPRPAAEETLLARKHAYGLFRLRPFRFTSYRSHFAPASELRHPLSHNLELTAPTPDEADLREFARWAEGREIDYLSGP
jgi:hypothetical protein